MLLKTQHGAAMRAPTSRISQPHQTILSSPPVALQRRRQVHFSPTGENPFVSQHQHVLHASSFAPSTSSSSTALHTTYSPIGMAAAVTTSPYSFSFLKYAIAFIAGGLFFSSAIAAVTACYAIGLDNVKRAWAMLKIVVANIWITFTMGLGAVKAAFLADGSWKWREAWTVLKEKLAETRKQAVEGVEAIKREANLYAAAVGAPGLIPLQYALDRLMPFSIATALEDSLKDSLADIKIKQVKKLALASFTAGTKAPKLEAARIYDLNEEAMAFDCDISWESELEATIRVSLAGGVARVPITIKNVRFQGVVRVIFTPLMPAYPGFGATLISLVNKPTIGLDVKVAGGELTRIPRLRSELLKAIQQNIADTMLWPKRVVVPSVGLAEKPVLPRTVLKALEDTDPLLQAEEALGSRSLLRRKMDTIMDGIQREEESDEEKLKAVGILPMPSFQEQQSNHATIAMQNGALWENLKTYIDKQAKANGKEQSQGQNVVPWEHVSTHNGHSAPRGFGLFKLKADNDKNKNSEKERERVTLVE